MHTHLKRDQRVALAALKKLGMSHRKVAKELGIHHATVGRELRRNSEAGHYHAAHARVLARERRKNSKQKYRKIENDPVLAAQIEHMLHPLTSPEVVAHELGLAHETIYAWIERSRPDLKTQLPYHGKKRHRYGGKRTQKQGWTKHVRNIAERPEEVSGWEGDTVKGATSAQLLTHVERKSLFTVVDLIPNGTADAVHAVLKRHQKITGTVTYDRGSEFALWQFIERDTDATVYFANAHHPWERGKNENTNGRLRRVFPKGFNFSTMRQGDIDYVVQRMNHTKRKSLSWQTSCAVFKRCCVSD